MTIRCRRFPTLCLLLSSLVAWPDEVPVASMTPPCAACAEARACPAQHGTWIAHDDQHHPPLWECGSTVLDDDEDGRPDFRAVFLAPTILDAGLPSLIPSSTLPLPAFISLAPGAFANDPPLRC